MSTPEQFSIIGETQAHYPVVTLCHVFGVHRSSYEWKTGLKNQTADGLYYTVRRLSFMAASATVRPEQKHRHNGNRRGYQMGRWLAGRLMKERAGRLCQQPTHRYKRGGHEHVAIPNYLERQFADQANQVWCGDVTYIWTGKRWAYLAVVLDLFARKPVGWAMSFSLDSRLTMKALEMAWKPVVSPAG